jgi:hypothetical protein
MNWIKRFREQFEYFEPHVFCGEEICNGQHMIKDVEELKPIEAFIQSEMNNLLDRVEKIIGEDEVKEKEKPKRGRPRRKPSITVTKIIIGEPIIIRNQLRQSQRQKLDELRRELS